MQDDDPYSTPFVEDHAPSPEELPTPAAPPPPATSADAPPRWSLAKRLAFRFALVYFVLYTIPFPLDLLPNPTQVFAFFGGEWPAAQVTDPVFEDIGEITGAVQDAERWTVDRVAASVFGFEETLDRPLGSGDPTYSYVRMAIHLALTVLLVALWSYLARRRTSHARLAPWFHLAGRYWLAFPMLGYGFAKVFPAQFSFPRLSRLVSDYGDSSPMNVLWSFMGTSSAYTVFAGAGEVLAGLLLCFRRTATLGALVAVGVMANVVALNFSYDVPVKLYSSHLLLAALLLTIPDVQRLLGVLLLNRTAQPRDLSRPRFPLMTGHVVKLLIVGTSIAMSVTQVVRRYGADDAPGPYYGIWDVERFAERADGGELVDDADPDWLALIIERERGGSGSGALLMPDHSTRLTTPAWGAEREGVTLSGSTRWGYREEGNALVLQCEYERVFREDPMDFQAAGTPRGPQVELELVRDEREDAPAIDPDVPVGEEVAADEADAPSTPEALVGRWRVVRTEWIGETYTRRRRDPWSWTAVTITGEGTAVFEFDDAPSETYALTADGDFLTVAWSSAFSVERKEATDGLVLRGDHRGRSIEVELARRDLNSFLLVRRGFHWINEIPLNRY